MRFEPLFADTRFSGAGSAGPHPLAAVASPFAAALPRRRPPATPPSARAEGAETDIQPTQDDGFGTLARKMDADGAATDIQRHEDVTFLTLGARPQSFTTAAVRDRGGA